jgi:excisionase family DNA binding protein
MNPLIILTAEDVAEILKLKSRNRVYDLVREKKLPCVKLSRKCYRFNLADIESFIKSGAAGGSVLKDVSQVESISNFKKRYQKSELKKKAA